MGDVVSFGAGVFDRFEGGAEVVQRQLVSLPVGEVDGEVVEDLTLFLGLDGVSADRLHQRDQPPVFLGEGFVGDVGVRVGPVGVAAVDGDLQAAAGKGGPQRQGAPTFRRRPR